MQVEYHAEKIRRPQYRCHFRFLEEDDQPCHSLKASPVDELVAQQVLRALEPAALDLSMQATMDIQRERTRLHQHWQQRLERAECDTQRAERQYQSVEPENRLVARTLEQRWEESLHRERQLREEHHRFLAETPPNLSDTDVERIRALSQNISALWHAPDTTAQDRKAIVRCLVDHVVVHVEPRSEYVDVTICWHGGFKSQHQVVRPVCCYSQLRDYDLLVARIKALHQQGKSVPAIAEQLNLEGFTTPSRRTVFSTGTLAPIMKRLGLRGELSRNDLLGPNEWWIRDLATKLKVPIHKVYYWATHGWVNARTAPSGKHWIVWADDDELKRLEKLKLQRNSHTAQRNPDLTTPKARKR